MTKPKRTQAKAQKTAPQIPTSLPTDLPAPSTSRNLLPRSRTASLARSRSGSGSRGSSRRSSTSLANVALLPVPISRLATPSSAGGTISLKSGNVIDPGQPATVPSGIPQSGKAQDSSAQPADPTSAPPSTVTSEEARPREQAFMDFTQGNRYYGCPQHLDEDMSAHSTQGDDEGSPSRLFPPTMFGMQNDHFSPAECARYRHGEATSGTSTSTFNHVNNMGMHFAPTMSGIQNEHFMPAERASYNDSRYITASTSSAIPNHANHTSTHQYESSMGTRNYGAINPHVPSWYNPSQNLWNISNEYRDQLNLPRPSSLPPSAPHQSVSTQEYNLAMGLGLKRKRSPAARLTELGVAGTSRSAAAPSQGNDDNEPFISASAQYDKREADEVEQELVPENKSDESTSAQEKDTVDRKGKGKARAQMPIEHFATAKVSSSSSSQAAGSSGPRNSTMSDQSANPMKPKAPNNPLSSYTCPICFSPPTNATITPCGHISCGECLFAAVKTTLQRSGAIALGLRNAPEARCPVCRAVIPGWDGKGGGVIGLKVRAVFSL